MLIDQTAYTNRWTLMHPGFKIIGALGLLTCCVISRNVFSCAFASLLAFGFAVVGARVPVKRFLGGLLPSLVFLLPALAAVLFTSESKGSVLWQASFLRATIAITGESARQALILGSRAFGAVACTLFLALTTPAADIMQRFRAWRVPPVFVDLMELMYGMIFILLTYCQNMIHAQALRFGYQSLRVGIQSLGAAFGNLFSHIFRRSGQMATACEARLGSGGMETIERSYQKPSFAAWLLVFAGGFSVLTGGIL